MDLNAFGGLTTILDGAAIVIMFYCLYLVFSLKSSIPGGVVGKQWSLLTLLVSIFTVGFLATPFFDQIPENLLRLLVGVIFLAGSIYVMTTIRMVYNIIRELVE